MYITFASLEILKWLNFYLLLASIFLPEFHVLCDKCLNDDLIVQLMLYANAVYHSPLSDNTSYSIQYWELLKNSYEVKYMMGYRSLSLILHKYQCNEGPGTCSCMKDVCVAIILMLILFLFQIRRHWGGGVMGSKSQARITKLEKAKAKELQHKVG